ncbi:glycosyl hydrolase family 28 protein [Sphingobium sp. TCM1]|uniref:glycosyl hydrolase family 28 protein n=2 Tax=unclassified Sphingobium TaxID=2611147 RepID=UPI000AD92BFE|nr:glycosyl hydrolase family 28 protein [Sphingobium sp. TCM1]
MKKTMMFMTAMSLGTLTGGERLDAQPIIYENPPGKALYDYHDDSFTVRVREPGGPWKDLYEYRVRVDGDNPQPASMVNFGMNGPVEVAVQKNDGAVRAVEIRPGSKAITARLNGNIAYFTLARPVNLSVEFDGDRLHNLHLFANPPEPAVPDRTDPNLIYFGSGIHMLPAGKQSFPIPSNKTVYVAGGAIVKGQLDISNATNVRVIGHGLLEGGKEGITVVNARNVLIDGPVVVNPVHYTILCGQSSGLTVRNFKTFSVGSWTDGIDLMSCSDVEIDNVFLRTSDDSIAIYADRWEHHGDARHYRVTNSTLWADVAHPINIGLHGSKDEPRVIEDLIFRNIDILGHDEDDRNYQGALAITDGDNNLVRKIVFEDIRIDRIEEGMIFNFRVLFNDKYSLAPGRGIEDVVVRNVRFRTGMINPSVVSGFAADRAVRGISIENVRVGDTLLRADDVEVGPFVKDFRVR